MKTALIINPCAGQRKAMKHLKEIAAVFQNAGDMTASFVTRRAGDGTRLARRLSRYAGRIVCIGGDGTFHEVVQGVMQAEKRPPIGYIPAGTTNDMSRSLGLSHDMVQAAWDILDGVVQPLDIGRFGERAFTYVAAFGAFTRVSYRTPQKLKNLFGHAAYVWAGAKSLPTLRGQRMRIQTESQLYHGEFIYGSLSNAVSLGGVLRFAPGLVDMGDGLLELLLIRVPRTPAELADCVRAVATRRFDSPLITLEQVHRAEVTADPRMPWALDGEKAPGRRHILLEADPGAIAVIRPCTNPRQPKVPHRFGKEREE